MLKRLPQDQLEDKSINAISNFFNEHKWEFNRLARDKSGIDAEIEIVHGIERTGKYLKCQVKAGRSYISSETDTEVRVRLERKYLEHWQKMHAPVILFFYHPDTGAIFWKAIKEYLALHPTLLTHSTESCVVVFDKEQEALAADSLPSLESVEAGKFSYENISVEPNRAELGWSNWFGVTQFPVLWQADAPETTRSAIVTRVVGHYVFVINANKLFTFTDLNDAGCELREFVRAESIRRCQLDEIAEPVLVDLLNRTLFALAKKRDLAFERDRFYFPSSLLNTPANMFMFPSLKGRANNSRTKVYLQKLGSRVEYKHHAVRLSFVRHLQRWFLEVDPDWHFSYPFGNHLPVREVGARITSEKAATYNKDYLYLLHFWRQFLSDCGPSIFIPCGQPDDSVGIEISSVPESFRFHFRLFNDYIGPDPTI